MKISHRFPLLLVSMNLFAQKSTEKLSYHLINTDSKGNLLSWYDNDA
jgi:hypothetical protein